MIRIHSAREVAEISFGSKWVRAEDYHEAINALRNMQGFFGTPVARLQFKEHWTPDHTAAVESARKVLES